MRYAVISVSIYFVQLIAVEALVHATSKKDKCVSIVNTAIPILKQMYKESPNDHIKARALVVRFFKSNFS